MSIKLTAQQLSMRFKDRVLFHIPQLSIGPNDAIYLKGDNGVGKTTLLKILSGLLVPTTGRVSNSQMWWRRIWRSKARRNVISTCIKVPICSTTPCIKTWCMAFVSLLCLPKTSVLK